jgi:pentatricopeptide repeat protein
MGRIQFNLGQYEAAIESAQMGIKSNPGYVSYESYTVIARAYSKMGRGSEALDVLTSYLEQDHDNIGALQALGMAYFNNVYDYQEAYRTYKRAEEISANNPATQQYIAEACLAVGRPEDALEIASRRLENEYIQTEEQLPMEFLQFSAYMLLDRHFQALVTLKALINHSSNFVRYYDIPWQYSGIRKFMEETEEIAQPGREIILQLIDILESPDKDERNRKIKELESSQTYRQLSRAAIRGF